MIPPPHPILQWQVWSDSERRWLTYIDWCDCPHCSGCRRMAAVGNERRPA